MEIKENDSCRRKEIYRLWWEYLKRSADYKEFIEKHPEVLKNNELLRYYSFDGYKHYDEIGEDNDDDPEYREYVKERDKWQRALWFGNVHKDSFESWWEKFTQLPDEKTVAELSMHIDTIVKKAYRESLKRSLGAPLRQTYKDLLSKNDLDSDCKGFLYWDYIRKYVELESKAIHEFNDQEEFSKALREKMKQPDQPYVYLRINADTCTDDDIAGIKKIIWDKKEGFTKRCNDEILRFHKPYFKEIGRIRYDELQRYLKIYDLRKDGMRWEDIFKKAYPKKKWNEENRRSILMDHTKAKRIIKNVEIGNFPGKYSG